MLYVNIEQFWYHNASEILILEDIVFSLQPGEHLAVLGESGCGKSTLLHIVYGLLHLEHGNLSWKDNPLLGPQHNLIPGELFMKLVAQEFNVMPYTSVSENIATHLSRNDTTKDAIRVSELLSVVDLEAYKDTKVKNLSGGQKQRVALAKALANTPEVILLDEPFSNIDTFRKNKLRRNLYGYLKANNITCITATHDSNEALGFADSILMLRHGKKEIMGTPQEIISNLSTPYQAGFFGSVSQIGNKTLLPHQLYISEKKTTYSGRVSNSYFKGHFYELEIITKSGVLYVQHPNEIPNNSEVFVAMH